MFAKRRIVELPERLGQDLEQPPRSERFSHRPELHRQRRIALDRSQLAQGRVALGEVLDPRALEVEVLVLQRVGVLVGDDDPVRRAERLVALDDVEALGLGPVERSNLAAVQLDQ